ncbi:hypothetical protein [Nocardioides sp. InS609-2]|uniref:hypothetical protein n=1 Tax=Nocardioides sp. InS609-2 TaxID=2760705 RepID=UPI0020BE594D|nr:hypothetical protein [Nocardioides sp. InS609-2]
MTGAVFYSLDGGDLRIARDDPPFEWRGRIDELPVIEVQPVLDGAFAIVLLEPPAGAVQVCNLVKVSSEAEVLWRGELPGDEAADCFVGFSVHADGNVSASTWSGYRVLLARGSGAGSKAGVHEVIVILRIVVHVAVAIGMLLAQPHTAATASEQIPAWTYDYPVDRVATSYTVSDRGRPASIAKVLQVIEPSALSRTGLWGAGARRSAVAATPTTTTRGTVSSVQRLNVEPPQV